MIHKLLHTADLHLSRTNHSLILENGRNSKLEDTLKAIKQIKQIIETDSIGVLVMAGDGFQVSRPNPTYNAVLIDLLWELVDKVALLIFISGNHDSSPSARYNAVETIASTFKNVQHYHFFYKEEVGKVEYQGINFVCMPHTNELRKKSAENIAKVIQKTPNLIEPDKVNILISHFPIDAAIHVFDESQLVTNDVSYEEIKDVFKKFDLVMLGDIHKFQKIGDNAFYSGSIIQNTFGEENEEKGVIVYNIDTTDKTYEHEFKKVYSREYKTIRLENIDQHKLHKPEDYKDNIIRVKLDINDIEKMLQYDRTIKDYFSESFIVLPDFSFINKQGKIIAELSSSDIIESVVLWVKESYKKDDDIEFLVSEATDILTKRIEAERLKELNDN